MLPGLTGSLLSHYFAEHLLASTFAGQLGEDTCRAAHRQFAWPMPSKVELVAASPPAFATLISAGARMEPSLLVLDGVQLEDVAALCERLLRGAPGTLAAVAPEVMSPALARSADLVARFDRGADGMFRVVSVEDSARAAVFGRGNAVRMAPQGARLGQGVEHRQAR